MVSDRSAITGCPAKNHWCDLIPRIRTPLLVSIACVSGVVVLLGYFIQDTLLEDLRNLFLHWFVILAAIALGVGVIFLFQVHWTKIRSGSQSRLNSGVLIVCLVFTAAITLIYGTTSNWSVWLLDHVILPVEASLVALLAVFLVYTLGRMFYGGFSLFNLVFALTAFATLAISALLFWYRIPWIGELRDWVNQVWSLGAMRAILIGVALGAITTGLRVLIGADRPYES